MKKALNRLIILAVVSAAHAGDQSVAADQISVLPATVNAATVGVHDYSVEGLRWARAMAALSASQACFASIRSLLAQPIILRVQRAMTTAKYSQPCGTQVGDITGPLLTRALRAEVLVKQVGATPNRWLASVVHLNRLAA